LQGCIKVRTHEMQSPSFPLPHSLSDFVWLILAGFFVTGGGAAWYSAWKNRNKPDADIHESQARTALTFAQARSKDLEANISAGDALIRMIGQVTLAQMAKERADAEVERLANENAAYEKQIRWAKATFKVKGIPWEDNPK